LHRYYLNVWPVLLSSALACTETHHLPPSYFFTATAQRYDSTTARTSRCVLVGHVAVDSFALPPWSAIASLQIRREVVVVAGPRVARDTALEVRISTRQDAGQLFLNFGPPFGDSLKGSAVRDLEQSSNGTWSCPSSLPFAEDSSLKANGYQAVPEPAGDWFFAPSLPIG